MTAVAHERARSRSRLNIPKLRKLSRARRQKFYEKCSKDELLVIEDELSDFGRYLARPSQQLPPGDTWRIFMMMAGRAFGKTRAGSGHTHAWARKHPNGRIALIARTAADARETMVEGVSGIMNTSSALFHPVYNPSKRRITWPNGCVATVFTAEEPDLLRGPEVGFWWADELASWKYLHATWDNLQFAARGGNMPRGIITTTPRPLQFLRDLSKRPDCVVSRGTTYENAANLPPAYLQMIVDKYEGTSIGRQEIHAELLDEAEGALFTRRMIEQGRIDVCPELHRVVTAIDPAVSAKDGSAETGIVSAGAIYFQNRPAHYYVLGDRSGIHKPQAWAVAAISEHQDRMGDRIVGEVNNGGDLVEHTLRQVDRDVPYKAVHASKGKRTRAEPVAAIAEQGRLHFVGNFPGLEDQLCNWEPESGDPSPDRLDAMVWAISSLMNEKDRPLPSMKLGGLTARSQWSL